MTWVILPAEMLIAGRVTPTKGHKPDPIPSLLCVGWDDETATAAGWPHPAGNDNAVT